MYAFRTYLRELVQSDHSWFVIFLVSVVYLVLVGTLFYKLSLQTLSWSAGLGILAVVVAAASFLFMGIGERGYLESDATHSLHYIQPLGGRMHDVTSYSNVFLTKGAEPVFQTDAGFGLFSSAQDLERVPAVITNGVHSGYRVDIPQFSHRLVIHKRQVSLDRPAFTRTAGEESISTGLEIEAMVEVEGKRLHWWVNRDGSWRRQRSFSLVMWQSASSNREEIGYRLLSTIMNSRLCVSLRDPGKPLAPPGQSDFYVLTAGAPNGLALESAPPTARSWTIYHFDLETPR